MGKISKLLEKLKKLKGKNLAEFKERGRQGANIFAERFGMSSQVKLPTDAQLIQKLDLPAEYASANRLLEYFRSRKPHQFYASFENPETTVSQLRQRFPAEEAAIINRAERIGNGFFDLLGHENLFFRNKVPDWHYDPLSQTAAPKVHWSKIEEVGAGETFDKKVIWELNRHQYLTTLGRAYWLTKDERYAEIFIAHLESWFAENPPKNGINWLSSLELAFRSISWLWALSFFRESPRLTPDFFVKMLKFLYLHARHLETYLSTYFSPNTHLTGEALGLYLLGTFLPEFKEADRWKNTGYKILLDSLDFQIRDDGVYCEQSSYYHRYTTDFYINLYILRELEGSAIERKHREKLNQLLEFLLFITEPNGETPLFGDDDGGRFYFLDEKSTNDFRPTLALGAVLFGRGDLKFAARQASAELLWLLGVEGLQKFDELKEFEPKQTSKTFEASGFYVMRDSWKADATFLLADCGRHGFLNCGHAHADALSFVLSANGEPIFVDPGTYSYASDLTARQLFRSTAMHNCLTVNGESSSIPGDAFSWKSYANARALEWQEDETSVLFRGSHDGFERFGVGYEREILLIKQGSIILTDSIKSAEINSYELNFILSPHLDAKLKNGFVTVFSRINGEERELLEISAPEVTGQYDGDRTWKIEDCWVSPRYGAKVDSKKLIFAARIKGDFQIRAVFEKVSVNTSLKKDKQGDKG